MRLLMVNLLAAALVMFSVASASAYQMNLVATTPTTGVAVGGLVSFDVFLNTEGQSDILAISTSFTFDPTVVAYRADLSGAEDYYPLYAPAGKGGTYLYPTFNPPAPWGGTLPAIGGQINVDFTEANLARTTATATNLYLATLTFEVVGPGQSAGEWGFGKGGNTFSTGTPPANVAGTLAFANGDAGINVIPEPTTALLVGLGLVGLGVAGRRRA
jgi:hypothetical protein